MGSSFEYYAPLAYKYIGKITDISFFKTLFEPISPDIKKIGIHITVEEYAALTVLTSALVYFLTTVPLTFIFSLVFNSLIAGIILGNLSGFSLGLATFFVFYLYPKNTLMAKKKKIDASLPFATYYLITIAESGATMLDLFKILANMKEHKSLSEEARRIVFEVENLGYNIVDALKNATDRTPSENFKYLLWGIRSTMIVGGDLVTYLREKSNMFLQEYKRNLVKFSQQLNLLVEIYITLMLVGSIFFIILTLVIGMMMQTIIIPLIQLFVIFIVLPLATFGFIIMFKTLSTEG